MYDMRKIRYQYILVPEYYENRNNFRKKNQEVAPAFSEKSRFRVAFSIRKMN